MPTTANDIDAFLDQFPPVAPGNAPLWLERARAAAREAFRARGLPTVHDEEWRNTSLAPLLKMSLRAAPQDAPAGWSEEHVATLLPAAAGPRLVFINGRYVARLSGCRGLPTGMQVGSLSEVLMKKPGLVEHYFADTRDPEHPFAMLNAAQFEDGAFIQLDRGITLERPIHILHVSTGGAAWNCPRTIIAVGESAGVRIVEVFAGEDEYFCNPVTLVHADPNSSVELLRIQRESEQAIHTGLVRTRQLRDSRVTMRSSALGSALSRIEFDASLDGAGAELDLAGLYLGHGRQHLDQHIVVDHAQPRGTSRQFFRGILDERSRGVFSGKVIVRPGAQKTDAQQQNNNLLLSDDATVDTKPQLEIYADDVKCSHGATSGQLSAEAMFFLRSRGLSAAAGRALLTLAFAGEVAALVKDDALRGYLESLIHQKLQA